MCLHMVLRWNNKNKFLWSKTKYEGHMIRHGNCILVQNGAMWEMKHICFQAYGMYWFKCYHMKVYVQGIWLKVSQKHISWRVVLLFYCGIKSKHGTKSTTKTFTYHLHNLHSSTWGCVLFDNNDGEDGKHHYISWNANLYHFIANCC
jgi:hypothetical protein